MKLSRTLTIPALALGALALSLTIGTLTPNPGVGTPTPTHTISAAPNNVVGCEEDMPCWDCEHMGNLICSVTDADKSIAWAAWDTWQGWRQLSVDPSRGFRVDVTGYSLVQPKSSRATPALQGADGKWYVFTATYQD